MNRSPRLITLATLVATVVGAVLSARSDAGSTERWRPS